MIIKKCSPANLGAWRVKIFDDYLTVEKMSFTCIDFSTSEYERNIE